jgi:hypothetical protein
MAQMQDYRHHLSMQQFCFKIATITQERVTPFRDGIPESSWVRWFKVRHLELTLRPHKDLSLQENVALKMLTLP